MNWLKKFLQDIFTDDDKDFDIVSILAAAAVVVFLALTVYVVVWQEKPLNGVEFGAASGALIASLGAAYRMKRNDKKAEDK